MVTKSCGPFFAAAGGTAVSAAAAGTAGGVAVRTEPSCVGAGISRTARPSR